MYPRLIVEFGESATTGILVGLGDGGLGAKVGNIRVGVTVDAAVRGRLKTFVMMFLKSVLLFDSK